MLFLLGASFVVAAGYIWLAPPPTTVQTTTRHTIERTVAPATKARRGLGGRTTVHIATVTTEILNGRKDQAGDAQPGGATSIRSDALTIALLTVGSLLIIVAAMPTLPTKLGFGAATAEWTPEDIAEATAATSAVAISAGVEDPKLVGVLARAVVLRATSQKATQPDAEVDWAYAAEAALKDVVPPGP